MKEIFRRLRVVSLDDVHVHEGTVDRWVERIADFIKHDGIMKNPIVCAEVDDGEQPRYVVLDGMHRVKAIRALDCNDILVFLADYWSESVKREAWDAVLLDPIDPPALVAEAAGDARAELVPLKNINNARHRLYQRDLAMAFVTPEHGVQGLRMRPRPGVELIEDVIRTLRRIEELLDKAGARAIYAPSSKSVDDYETTGAEALFLRPLFSKSEVLDRTLAGNLFPRKSTRFLVPERPLRVDFQLTVLKAELDHATKNRLLDEHLQWCWEANRVRYYPEPVFVFGD